MGFLRVCTWPKLLVIFILILWTGSKFFSNNNTSSNIRKKRSLDNDGNDDYDTSDEVIPKRQEKFNMSEILRVKRLLNKSISIKICSVSRPPIQTLKIGKEGKLIMDGFSGELLNNLVDYFNFSYKLISPDDGFFGMPKKVNGSIKWNGMIGMLHKQEADMCTAMFTVQALRQRVVEFSSVIYEEENAMLSLRPKILTEDKDGALLAPFSPAVWVTMTVVSVCICPVLYLALRSQHRLLDSSETVADSGARVGFLECVWFIYSSIVKQGTNYRPRLDSSRLLFMSWWLTCGLLATFYTANLTASLTLPSTIIRRTLREYLNSDSTLKWTIHENGALDTDLQVRSDGNFGVLKDSFRSRGRRTNNDSKIVKDVIAGRTIFLHEKSTLNHIVQSDYLANKRRCRLRVTVGRLPKESFAFAYRIGFPYAKAFDLHLIRLKSGGLVKKWRRKYLPVPESCATAAIQATLAAGSADAQPTLSMESLHAAFFLYAVGLTVGACFLVLEWVSRRKCKGHDMQGVEGPPPDRDTDVGKCSVKTSMSRRRRVKQRIYSVH